MTLVSRLRCLRSRGAGGWLADFPVSLVQVVDTIRNLVPAAAAAYVVDCLFCVVAPRGAIKAMLLGLWALGPPANLIHGADYLAPFAIGTFTVGLTFVACVRAKARRSRMLLLVLLVALWVLFGFIAYAPGS